MRLAIDQPHYTPSLQSLLVSPLLSSQMDDSAETKGIPHFDDFDMDGDYINLKITINPFAPEPPVTDCADPCPFYHL